MTVGQPDMHYMSRALRCIDHRDAGASAGRGEGSQLSLAENLYALSSAVVTTNLARHLPKEAGILLIQIWAVRGRAASRLFLGAVCPGDAVLTGLDESLGLLHKNSRDGCSNYTKALCRYR